MFTTQDNRSKKSCICSIESNNISTTRVPVYCSIENTIMENPFQKLNESLTEVKIMLRILLENQSRAEEKSDLIDLDETSNLLKISKSSIYKMTAKNTIPTIKRVGSKKLIFSRTQLDSWLKESQTNYTSIENLVDETLHKNLRLRKMQNN